MALPIPKLTPEQYLDIERKAEFKSEYYNGEMFAMAGGSPLHLLLASRLLGLLYGRLSGRGCTVYNSDCRVQTHRDELYTYPDVTVACGKPIFDDDQLTNPKLIIEVLSPSTEIKDREFKFRRYKTIDTLQEYVLVAQFDARVECFYRSPGGLWGEYSDFDGLDTTATFKSLGIEIPLAEIYQDIEFGPGEPPVG